MIIYCSTVYNNFNNVCPDQGSGYGSSLNFLRWRSFESGRVLNFNSFSPIRGPGYKSGIKFVTWHNTESRNELNFNFFIPRYGSGTLL